MPINPRRSTGASARMRTRVTPRLVFAKGVDTFRLRSQWVID
jgi:hypothetical protein